MHMQADMVHESWPICVCNIFYVLSLNYFKFKLRERAFYFYGGGGKEDVFGPGYVFHLANNIKHIDVASQVGAISIFALSSC